MLLLIQTQYIMIFEPTKFMNNFFPLPPYVMFLCLFSMSNNSEQQETII